MDEAIKGYNAEKKIITEALASGNAQNSTTLSFRLSEIDKAIKELLTTTN